MNKITFFRESLKNLRTTGSVVRSSKYLCAGMLKPIDFGNAKIIVEMGAGDGVFTRLILAQMKPDAALLCFEINPIFCEALRQIEDPRFFLIEDSAEKINEYLLQMNLEGADYVISGIPFIALPNDLSYRIVRSAFKGLKKGGTYVQFHYATILKRMYQTIFGNLAVKFVALNIPPAFVMICVKQ